jgi:hypothetical protein
MRSILTAGTGFLLFLSSCILSGKSMDKDNVRYITKNRAAVEEAVRFSILNTIDSNIHYFHTENIADKKIRKKLAALGNDVTVYYKEKNYDLNSDSLVSFLRITPIGTTQIFYDFALRQRELRYDVKQHGYYFTKVADRIYYLRRPMALSYSVSPVSTDNLISRSCISDLHPLLHTKRHPFHL